MVHKHGGAVVGSDGQGKTLGPSVHLAGSSMCRINTTQPLNGNRIIKTCSRQIRIVLCLLPRYLVVLGPDLYNL